jgi:FkbM family methyltransferase
MSLLDQLALPILKGTLAGKRWLVKTRINFFLGTYEPDQSRLFEEYVKPGAVVCDLGAHVGYYTLLAAVLSGPGGKVYAFEPSPRNLSRLRRHVAMNACQNIVVFDYALSDHEGTAHFETQCGSGVGHLSESGGIEVKLTTLDILAAEGRITLPNVLKIDVEGAEYDVLTGGIQLLTKSHPVIFLSTHNPEVKAKCLRLLEGLGYAFRTFDGAPLEAATDFLATPQGIV